MSTEKSISYKDAVLAANKDVQVVITAKDNVWLPGHQHSAVAAMDPSATFILVHRDGREATVGSQQLARVLKDDLGESLAALFFSPAESNGDDLAQKIILLEGNVQGLIDRLADATNEVLGLHKRVEDLEAQFQTGRIPALENAVAKIKSSKAVNPPATETPATETQPK